MKPTPKLGDLLLQSYVLSEDTLNEALLRSLTTRRFLGEVLVGDKLVSGTIIDAAIDMQEMIDNSTLSAPHAVEALTLMKANGASLVVAVAEVGAYKPRMNKAVKLCDLLTSSGALAPSEITKEIQDHLKVNYNQARQVVRMLIEGKLVPEALVYNALRCVYLIDENLLNLEKSIIALDHTKRNCISIDQTLLELGWTKRTRLRVSHLPAPQPAPTTEAQAPS
jgi:hypothetical protein